MCVSQGDWDIVCVYLKVIGIQCVYLKVIVKQSHVLHMYV